MKTVINLGIFSGMLFCNANAKLQTNQDYIETVQQKSPVDLSAINDVFGFVYKKLPDTVTVYPTENYYYFSFYDNGIQISGNIRLDALDRDKGIAHFAYFTTYNYWNEDLVNHYKQITKKDGLTIKKIDDLKYQLEFNNKKVTFLLNDLSKVKPPKNILGKNEKYIGPVYDESGIQLYLVYNNKQKVFHYLLNEQAPQVDKLIPSQTSKDIVIGNRTGFAFYYDKTKDRHILVGVYQGNSVVNNYLDGPFDQLPDNFIKGKTLQNALIDKTPELEGKIDRFGNTDQGNSRVLITPYLHYYHESELGMFTNCVEQNKKDNEDFYRCFDKDFHDQGYDKDDV